MKKLLALLLAVLMMFSLVACGGDANSDDVDSSSTPGVVTGQDDGDEFEEEEEEEKEPLVLDGSEPYVVAIKKGKGYTLSHIKDIKGRNVGYAFEGDGQKLAEYFKANCIGYGGENDAFSELVGGTSLEFVIVKKAAAQVYVDRGDAEIVLDPIVVE
jgi:hypothetical protein